MRARMCPYCGMKFTDVPATSRRDRKTLICPDCYARESMDIFGMSDQDKDKVIDMIHRRSK